MSFAGGVGLPGLPAAPWGLNSDPGRLLLCLLSPAVCLSPVGLRLHSEAFRLPAGVTLSETVTGVIRALC